MARTISGLNGVADQQTLDKLKVQVSRLESSGRAYLGVYLRSGNNCALVDQTEDGTPASYVFRRNDQIVAIGAFTVTDSDSLRRALLTIEPGTTVMVKYYRDGNLESTTITPASKSVGQMPLSHRALGIAYSNLGRTSDAASQLGSYLGESPDAR
jgi:S1-C subfamily serine protease